MKLEELTGKIIGIYYEVYNELGHGFLEKVYQNAFYLALKEKGYNVKAQQKIDVWFRKKIVGEYFADLIVNDLVILELKAKEHYSDDDEAQLLNYLRGTEIEVGLLFNFGKTPGFTRKVYDNELKKNINKKKNTD